MDTCKAELGSKHSIITCTVTVCMSNIVVAIGTSAISMVVFDMYNPTHVLSTLLQDINQSIHEHSHLETGFEAGHDDCQYVIGVLQTMPWTSGAWVV